MARVNAQQWLQKWGNALSASGTAISAGVDNVKTAPGVTAAAAQDRMLAGINDAVTSGRWAKAVAGVSLDAWKQSMKNKGIPHIAQGVAQAQSTKVTQITALLNAVDASTQAIASLPKGGLENNINRATAFMRAMSQNAPKKNT